MKQLLSTLMIALLLFGFKASPTKTISGIVTAADDSKPIPDVHISTLQGSVKARTDKNGRYTIKVSDQESILVFSYIGFQTQKVKIKGTTVNVVMVPMKSELNEVVIVGYGTQKKVSITGAVSTVLSGRVPGVSSRTSGLQINGRSAASQQLHNTESYAAIDENTFRNPLKNPLSTFSIDVDAASYSNVRRMINNGNLPPKDAVRIEEMINYFDYNYEGPTGSDPVNIITEITNAPWNTNHKLVQIALQGRKVPTDNLPASNLVFLIDVSGSMNAANRLPLLVSSFKLLTDQLRPSDRVAIVVYAGNSGLVLPSTPGNQKTKIKDALDKLTAGGSTAGGEGIKLAYKVATEHFINGGNNRVILATDGDFNVGASSDAEMQRLIEEQRKSGVFLTTLGFGMGNYKDSKMETLANKGNGNYAYIDNISEARKVLVNEFGGTLFTIAKDVKLQVEFNPSKVQAYRLVGYENRLLKDEDFNDDRKDAGELGAGHTVTAFYEIIPAGVKSKFLGSVDDLKYQKTQLKLRTQGGGTEMLTVKLRYKQPDGGESRLIEKAIVDKMVPFGQTSENFRFATAVAEFGLLLRNSEFRQKASFGQLLTIAEAAKGKDAEGYRSEFIRLAKSAQLMAKDLLTLKNENNPDQTK
jgi:Ca-activated chloride channel family protein